jgi:hypothetical protein
MCHVIRLTPSSQQRRTVEPTRHNLCYYMQWSVTPDAVQQPPQRLRPAQQRAAAPAARQREALPSRLPASAPAQPHRRIRGRRWVHERGQHADLAVFDMLLKVIPALVESCTPTAGPEDKPVCLMSGLHAYSLHWTVQHRRTRPRQSTAVLSSGALRLMAQSL